MSRGGGEDGCGQPTSELREQAVALLHRYARLVDDKDLDGLAGIVSDDVELSRRDGTTTGRAAFVELYRRFAASDVLESLHTVSTVDVEPAAGGRLQVHAAFIAFTTHPDGARITWGRYRDELTPQPDGRLLLSAKRIRIGRTALLPESMLAPLSRDSFGPMGAR